MFRFLYSNVFIPISSYLKTTCCKIWMFLNSLRFGSISKFTLTYLGFVVVWVLLVWCLTLFSVISPSLINLKFPLPLLFLSVLCFYLYVKFNVIDINLIIKSINFIITTTSLITFGNNNFNLSFFFIYVTFVFILFYLFINKINVDIVPFIAIFNVFLIYIFNFDGCLYIYFLSTFYILNFIYMLFKYEKNIVPFSTIILLYLFCLILYFISEYYFDLGFFQKIDFFIYKNNIKTVFLNTYILIFFFFSGEDATILSKNNFNIPTSTGEIVKSNMRTVGGRLGLPWASSRYPNVARNTPTTIPTSSSNSGAGAATSSTSPTSQPVALEGSKEEDDTDTTTSTTTQTPYLKNSRDPLNGGGPATVIDNTENIYYADLFRRDARVYSGSLSKEEIERICVRKNLINEERKIGLHNNTFENKYNKMYDHWVIRYDDPDTGESVLRVCTTKSKIPELATPLDNPKDTGLIENTKVSDVTIKNKSGAQYLGVIIYGKTSEIDTFLSEPTNPLPKGLKAQFEKDAVLLDKPDYTPYLSPGNPSEVKVYIYEDDTSPSKAKEEEELTVCDVNYGSSTNNDEESFDKI